MNHIFMMNKIIKKQKSPFFRASTEFYGVEARKNGDFCFFLKSIKSKIVILSQFWDLQALKAWCLSQNFAKIWKLMSSGGV